MESFRISPLICVAGIAVGACSSSTASPGSTVGGGGLGGVVMMDAGDSTPDDGGAGPTGPGSPDTGTGVVDPGGSDAGSSASDSGASTTDAGPAEGGGACASVGGGANQFTSGKAACDQCLAQSCCSQVGTCTADEQCLMLVRCVTKCVETDAGTALSCATMTCAAYLGAASEATPLQNCESASCATACGT